MTRKPVIITAPLEWFAKLKLMHKTRIQMSLLRWMKFAAVRCVTWNIISKDATKIQKILE